MVLIPGAQSGRTGDPWRHRADALYRLALAQRDGGDPETALTTVVRALEIAPNFMEALELLLELREGTS